MELDNNKSSITLVTGGVRSGKSSYVLKNAETYDGKKIFLATAPNIDKEMDTRIKNHKEERNSLVWETIEEEVNIIDKIQKIKSVDILVIDCLTLWLSNLIYHKSEIDEEFVTKISNDLIETTRNLNAKCYFVTNEIGMGVHPVSDLGRKFEDLHGRMNQTIGKQVDKLCLMVCGKPLIVS